MTQPPLTPAEKALVVGLVRGYGQRVLREKPRLDPSGTQSVIFEDALAYARMCVSIVRKLDGPSEPHPDVNV